MHEPGTLAVPGFSPPRAGNRTDEVARPSERARAARAARSMRTPQADAIPVARSKRRTSPAPSRCRASCCRGPGIEPMVGRTTRKPHRPPTRAPDGSRKPARGPCRPHSRRSRSAQWQKIGVSGYGILSNEGALGEAQLPPPFRGHPHMVSGRKDHGTGNILRRITAPSPLRKTISTANPAPARMHPSPKRIKIAMKPGTNERSHVRRHPNGAPDGSANDTANRHAAPHGERHGGTAPGPPPRAGSTPLTSRARAPPPPTPPRTSPWGR